MDLNNHLHMILHHLLGVDVKLIPSRNPFKDLAQALRDPAAQHHAPILRHPDQMVFEIIDSAPRPLQPHRGLHTTGSPLRGLALFLPPASWGVSKGGFL